MFLTELFHIEPFVTGAVCLMEFNPLQFRRDAVDTGHWSVREILLLFSGQKVISVLVY